jgi:hypothetical protein
MSDLTAFHGTDLRPEPSPGGVGQKKAKGSRRFRVKASPEQWKKLRAQKLVPCLVCQYLGVEQNGDSELHHVCARSLGGSDVAANLASVCRRHHQLIEGRDPETCRLFAAAVQKFDDDAYAYAIETLGEDVWTRRYYVRFSHRAEGSVA